MLLKNKSAVVYGARGAIGGAVSRAFAREGANVIVAGRTLAKLEKVANEIAAAGGSAESAQLDAFNEKAIEKHAADMVAKTGSIDISFNAIRIDGTIQGMPLLEQSPDDISLPCRDRVATNFLTARAAARHMVRKGSGVILMFTASPARMAFPLTGAQGVAMAAIEGLCRSLASEIGPLGVRVICLRSAGSPESFPGTASGATPLGQTRAEVVAKLAERTLLNRLPSLLEVGNVAAFLASNYASPMTGTVANITCGTTAD